MTKGELFPVAERGYHFDHKLRVRFTGVIRPPKAGEWYISGAIPEGYKAHGNLTARYPIAQLVCIEVTTQYHVTGIVEG